MQLFGRRAQRQREVEAPVVGLDAEAGDVARRGGQRAVEVAREVAQRVELAVEARACVEQRDLVVEPLLGVAGPDLFGEDLRADDRQVGGDDRPHALLEGRGRLAGQRVDALDLAVEAALPHRVADVERLSGVEVADGLLEDEPRRALVDADTRKGGDVDEADRDRGVYLVVELLDAVVDECREEGVRPAREPSGNLQQRGAHRDVQLVAEVFADDFDRVGHRGFLYGSVGKGKNYL